jgi:type IV pilus assembly protein PilB
LVSSTIICVCAQRLLRRLCSNCKEEYEPDEAQKLLVGLDPKMSVILHKAKGCKECNGIGYKGRIGTHEIFVPDDDVRLGISKGTLTAENLKRIGVERLGMTTLYWDAMEKVRNGVTTVEDVLAKIRKDEFDSRPMWMFEQYQMKPPVDRSKPLI